MTAAEKRSENADRYALLKAAGLCVSCKGTPQPGKVRCKPCEDTIEATRRTPGGLLRRRAANRKAARKLRAARIARGCCPKCATRVKDGYTCCRPCRRLESLRQLRPGRKQRRCTFCRELGHTRQSCEARARHRIVEAALARVAA